MDPDLSAARGGDEAAFVRLIDPLRRELRAHCYRMSGSLHDAEDLLQESLFRAWRGIGGFEGRSSLRTWLHQVATRTCLDALDGRAARLLPVGLSPAASPDEPMARRDDPVWLEPFPEDPQALAESRESIGLAFVTALQLLAPRQRAVLLLREVVGLDAAECASLLETSVAAVNSALQRARETVSRAGPPQEVPDDAPTRALLTRYVRAWEEGDVAGLVSLLREDATLSMPPWSSWFQGPEAIGRSLAAMVLPPGSAGRFRLLPTRANGLPAFAAYESQGDGHRAAAIHLVEPSGGRIAAITAFVDPSLFPRFGLPAVPA